MAYTKVTNFAVKDGLPSGNPAKIVKGTEIDVEFNAIQAESVSINSTLSGKQPLDATLTSIAALGTAADKLAYTTAIDTWAETPLTAAARTILDDTTVANMRTTLGAAASGANTDITSLANLTSINGGQLAGLRNKVINGGCQVAQRASAAIVNNEWTYGGADRICCAPQSFTTASGTLQQYPNHPTQSTFAQGVYITTTGNGDITFQHRIETANCRNLNNKTVTATVYVMQTTGSPINAQLLLNKANVDDTFSAQTPIGSGAITQIPSDIYTKLTCTLTLGASDASTGIALYVVFTDVGAVTNRHFITSDWQLEVGAVSTPLEHRPHGLELALCQRYYESGTTHNIPNWCYSSGLAMMSPISYKSKKRTIPTIVATPSGFSLNSFTSQLAIQATESQFTYLFNTPQTVIGTVGYGVIDYTLSSEL